MLALALGIYILVDANVESLENVSKILIICIYECIIQYVLLSLW